MSQDPPVFERVDRNGTATLVITGELDLACVGELRDQLDAITSGAPPTGVVDLAGVTFLDSSGLGVLIAAKKRAVAADTDLELAAPSAVCRQVLELSGADQFFLIRE